MDNKGGSSQAAQIGALVRKLEGCKFVEAANNGPHESAAKGCGGEDKILCPGTESAYRTECFELRT